MKKSSSNKIENEVLREQVESIQSDVNELKKAVEIMRFAVSSVRNSMNNIASVANTFSQPAQRISKYLRHLHYAHEHGCCHSYYHFGKSGEDENEKSCLFTPRTQQRPCLLYEQQQVEDYKNLLYEKNIKISKNIEKNICINADKVMIERLIDNLLNNAMKFTKDTINIKLYLKEENCILEVEDNGIGISDENKKLIWSRFFQVNDSRNKKNKQRFWARAFISCKNY